MPDNASDGELFARGRPPSTTHREVERVALALFARDGFELTTISDIAAALGIGRRTLFRYFASKNDIVWGDFTLVCSRLRRLLQEAPVTVPVLQALGDAVVESNRYDPDQRRELLIRMRLITSVPALQAHSMLRYREWRAVVEEFVARRRNEAVTDPIPQLIGQVALGASMAAFVHWVENPAEDLEANLRQAYGLLRTIDLSDAGAAAPADPDAAAPAPSEAAAPARRGSG